ncbi:MAG TPA: nitric oxide reductase transcriptional regulator NorR [Kofleriaceae bacterium]|nr:nitric oxide reductase transcriptional regulator NorR [Kofleriaceae bacterium]
MQTAVVVLTTDPGLRPPPRRRHDHDLQAVRSIALDLAASLGAADRYQRLIDAVVRVIPADSAALLRLDGDALVPLAVHGLVPEAMTRRFAVAEHPRIAQILQHDGPRRFGDSPLPDPFDGLILHDRFSVARVHACMGRRLQVEGTTIGLLAVDAVDPRAFDHIVDELVDTVAALAAAAIRTSALVAAFERDAAHSDLVARQLVRDAEHGRGQLLGGSPEIRALRDEISLSARTDLAVLITGETGVGKELVAGAIHAESGRADAPLIHVNCAALPESIAESELFGHVRGSFTGAVEHRAGKFEVADRGTLFLDEVGELPLSIQPKLLRVLQSGEIQRVGSDRAIVVDVRVIAATNRDLAAEVAAGRFRADLFHRLNVYPVAVPPLRVRGDDVAILAGHFLDVARARLGLGPVTLPSSARAALCAHDWPGNVRELEHTLTRAALRAAGVTRRAPVVVDVAQLGLAAPPAAAAGDDAADLSPLEAAVDEFKRRRIQAAVAASGGNWARAARRLGLDRGNLHRTAHRLGLKTSPG